VTQKEKLSKQREKALKERREAQEKQRQEFFKNRSKKAQSSTNTSEVLISEAPAA
jgi:hypothetical protein